MNSLSIPIDSDYFDRLPDEMILELAYVMSITDIKSLCRTGQRFNRIICDNEIFWRNKLFREIGPIDYDGNWKEMYMYSQALWGYGKNDVGH